MKNTNFDRYLAEQLKDPEFARRFQKAGEAWDVALPDFGFMIKILIMIKIKTVQN